jgi:hypothetical protein
MNRTLPFLFDRSEQISLLSEVSVLTEHDHLIGKRFTSYGERYSYTLYRIAYGSAYLRNNVTNKDRYVDIDHFVKHWRLVNE